MMNRADFMTQLESLLQNISPTEREEALQYYNDYFNDAGEENEQEVIEALGNPAKVAENIKKEIYGAGYGEAAYQKAQAADRAIVQYQSMEKQAQEEAKEQNGKKEKKELSPGIIVLLVIGIIMMSPVILGAAGSVLGILAGLLSAWFGLIVVFGVAAVALILVLFALVLTGLVGLFTEPVIGMALIGAGLFCGGLGILFLMLTIAMAGIATPAIFQGLCNLIKRITKKA